MYLKCDHKGQTRMKTHELNCNNTFSVNKFTMSFDHESVLQGVCDNTSAQKVQTQIHICVMSNSCMICVNSVLLSGTFSLV